MNTLRKEWHRLIEAPIDLLGKDVTLLHFSGATEKCVLETEEQAALAFKRGYIRYKLDT